jgi:diguanylate cyclase (GGDEF)-like protein
MRGASKQHRPNTECFRVIRARESEPRERLEAEKRLDACATRSSLRGKGRMLDLDCKGCPKPTMEGLRALQHDVLESLARGKPIEFVMGQLCRHAEGLAPETICSVLSVGNGRLHTLAAPSLPQYYCAAINDLAIGPDVGCCGAAAFLGRPIGATDLSIDPRWAAFKHLALPLGLRACWSAPIHASDGRVIGTFAFYFSTCREANDLERLIVGACVDLCAIALEQEERNAKIHRLAYFDPLTGAANRVALERYGAGVTPAAIAQGARVALHCIDLDNFKEINDTLGHRAGDLVLEVVAERIRAKLSSGDFFARVGGDEFIVVQSGAASKSDIRDFAFGLMSAMSAPLELEDAAVNIGASIGIARAPEDGADLADLMKKGDIALYDAKASGRGRVRFFDAAIETSLAANRRIRQELKRALAGNELDLHFQPIVDLATEEINGFEALVRWRHPIDGLREPAQFLPVAEKAGLMCEIGDWVLRRACALATSLPETMRVCVNLSPVQLEKPGFALDVASAVLSSGLSPRRLELEITESTLLVESSATLACLSDIRSIGVSVALDDFGTGCSALSHLRAFPIDRIKIDRSFVQEAVARPETAAIVRTIIGLARDLGVKTTAEGVETKAQLRMLREFGCDEIQGYLISRPRELDAFLSGPFETRRFEA